MVKSLYTLQFKEKWNGKSCISGVNPKMDYETREIKIIPKVHESPLDGL